LSYFASEIGTTTSVKNITNILAEEKRSVSRESIYNYLAAAEDALFLTRVKRYDVKGKDLLRGMEKVYLTDVGFRETLFRNNDARIDLVLENIVFCELRRRGFEVFIGKCGQQEIDFIARKGTELRYYQVAYLLESEATRTREFSVYEGVDDNYPKYVLSLDEIDFSAQGIIHVNLIDFLLAE
jgi:predicted AAA+ superfamily ATPase